MYHVSLGRELPREPKRFRTTRGDSAPVKPIGVWEDSRAGRFLAREGNGSKALRELAKGNSASI